MQSLVNKITCGRWQDYSDKIPDKSIDMILSDPPSNKTACKWDAAIDLEEMWSFYNRVIKDNGAVVLCCTNMSFCVDVINANRKYFKYELIWDKKCGMGHLAEIKPIVSHEILLLFGKSKIVYNPQMEDRVLFRNYRNKQKVASTIKSKGFKENLSHFMSGKKYPISIISISKVSQELNSRYIIHSTQKPLELFAYLVKTYTNEKDTVLDNYSGSGTTAHACLELNRQFICFEQDTEYYNKSIERITPVIEQGRFF